MTTLLIRADASTRIGAGHLMRCLALAQACCDQGGRAAFACAEIEQTLKERLVAEGLPIYTIAAEPASPEDAAQLVALAGQLNTGWVVADGYVFCAAYQRAIKEGGSRLLVLDDYGHAEHYHADVILNQNSSANAALYSRRDDQTQLLLGLRYVLLRREFHDWRDWNREVPEVARKVLVTLGWGEYHDLTLRIVRAIQQTGVDGLEARVLVSGTNLYSAELHAAVNSSPVPIVLQAHGANLPDLMAWADVAVAGGGTNSWERAFLGLPSLVVVLADNQREAAAFCERQRIGLNLGEHQSVSVPDLVRALKVLLTDRGRRSEMARSGPELVDGCGAVRVLAHIKERELHIRRVREDDCRRIWEWANDATARTVSFSQDAIPWERHVEWFAARLRDPGCEFFIALTGQQEPIGQVRFDVNGSEAVISVSLAPGFRGKGYGAMVIRKASGELLDCGRAEVIHAYMQPTNEASRRAFAKAGYALSEPTVISGQTADHMVLQK